MKARVKKFNKQIKLSNDVIEVLRWIDSLTPKQKKMVELLVRVETAQKLMKEYLYSKRKRGRESDK